MASTWLERAVKQQHQVWQADHPMSRPPGTPAPPAALHVAAQAITSTPPCGRVPALLLPTVQKSGGLSPLSQCTENSSPGVHASSPLTDQERDGELKRLRRELVDSK